MRQLQHYAVLLASLSIACGGLTAGPASLADANGRSDQNGVSDDASAGPSSDGAPLPGAVDAGDTKVPVLTRADALIDLFPIADGAIVVAAGGVLMLGRDGAIKRTWYGSRTIAAAAFDGSSLAIVDSAMLTVLDVAFNVVTSTTLSEPCGSAVILDSARLACGAADDFERKFSIYDLATLHWLATSAPYTYNGIPMRRIPGTNDFVTVSTDSSPSDFHLYRVTGQNEVLDLGSSNLARRTGLDLAISNVYAFTGLPADHLINESGAILKIYDPKEVGFPNPFSRDGDLGTVAAGEKFLALDGDGAQIFGFIGMASARLPCEKGCSLEKIDAGARQIVSRHRYTFDTVGAVLMRHDSFVGKAWVALIPHSSTLVPEASGFFLQLLDY